MTSYRCLSRQMDASDCVVCTDGKSKLFSSWRIIPRFREVHSRSLVWRLLGDSSAGLELISDFLCNYW